MIAQNTRKSSGGDAFHPLVLVPMLAEHHRGELRAATLIQQSHDAHTDRIARKTFAALRLAYQNSVEGMRAIDRLEADYWHHDAQEDAVLPRLEVSAGDVVRQIVEAVVAWFNRLTGDAIKKTTANVRASAAV